MSNPKASFEYGKVYLMRLPLNRSAVYRDWLNGSTSSLEVCNVEEGQIIYIATPSPWSFWVGVGVISGGSLVPALMFKNVVPILEVWDGSSCEQDLPLNPRGIPQQVRKNMDEQLLIRNPGLKGLIELLQYRPESL